MAVKSKSSETIPESNSQEAIRQTGWKTLPRSLKILTALVGLGIIASIISFGKTPVAILGFVQTGIASTIASIALNILAPGILFFAVLKRLPWAWKYSLAYLGFFFLNGLIGFTVFITSSGVKDIAGITILMLFFLAVELALLVAVYRQKRYFE